MGIATISLKVGEAEYAKASALQVKTNAESHQDTVVQQTAWARTVAAYNAAAQAVQDSKSDQADASALDFAGSIQAILAHANTASDHVTTADNAVNEIKDAAAGAIAIIADQLHTTVEALDTASAEAAI